MIYLARGVGISIQELTTPRANRTRHKGGRPDCRRSKPLRTRQVCVRRFVLRRPDFPRHAPRPPLLFTVGFTRPRETSIRNGEKSSLPWIST